MSKDEMEITQENGAKPPNGENVPVDPKTCYGNARTAIIHGFRRFSEPECRVLAAFAARFREFVAKYKHQRGARLALNIKMNWIPKWSNGDALPPETKWPLLDRKGAISLAEMRQMWGALNAARKERYHATVESRYQNRLEKISKHRLKRAVLLAGEERDLRLAEVKDATRHALGEIGEEVALRVRALSAASAGLEDREAGSQLVALRAILNVILGNPGSRRALAP